MSMSYHNKLQVVHDFSQKAFYFPENGTTISFCFHRVGDTCSNHIETYSSTCVEAAWSTVLNCRKVCGGYKTAPTS